MKLADETVVDEFLVMRCQDGDRTALIAAGALFYFCIYQFFLQESTMAMLAYGFAVVMCVTIYGCILLFFWIQMKHNTTAREPKRVELQLALLSRQLQQEDA